VQDEIALKEENEHLEKQVQTISRQYHETCHELEKVKTENDALVETVHHQEQQIQNLNENLNAFQKLYNDLEEKFNKVIKFIEKMNLKEKLNAFLQTHHRHTL